MQQETVKKIFKRIPTIETDRFILRKIKVSDYLDMYEYSKLEKVTKYLLWRPHPDARYTRDYLSYVQSQYRAGEFYDWAIIEKTSNKMIGTCGFAKLDTDNNCAEIGYVINPEYWGKGIATECVKRVIEFGFNELNLHRIEARYIVGNEVSRNVMEKCGMVFEGVHRSSLFVKDEYVSVGYCALTYDDYLNMRY